MVLRSSDRLVITVRIFYWGHTNLDMWKCWVHLVGKRWHHVSSEMITFDIKWGGVSDAWFEVHDLFTEYWWLLEVMVWCSQRHFILFWERAIMACMLIWLGDVLLLLLSLPACSLKSPLCWASSQQVRGIRVCFWFFYRKLHLAQVSRLSNQILTWTLMYGRYIRTIFPLRWRHDVHFLVDMYFLANVLFDQLTQIPVTLSHFGSILFWNYAL